MRTRRWLGVLLALVVLAVAACGDDDDGSTVSGGGDEAAADGVGGGVAEGGVHRVRQAVPRAPTRGSRSRALTSWRPRSSRASSPMSTPPPTRSCPTSLREGPGREADGVRRQRAGAGGAGRRDKVSSLEDLDEGRRDDRDRLRRTCRSAPTRAPCSTSCRPKQSEAILANVRSEEPDVAGITGKLTQGAVDAGFLYASDVRRDRRQAEGDRAARRPAADGRVRRRGGQGRQATRGWRRRSSTGCSTAPARRRWRTRASCRRRGSEAARAGSPALLVAALTLALLFLTLPIVAIFVDTGPAELVASLGEEGALEALRLSLVCSAVAVAIIVVVGTPGRLPARDARASAAARRSSRSSSCRWCCRPRSRGSALLAALGPQRRARRPDRGRGHPARARPPPGVILALTFVAAPFYMRQAQAGFEALDRTWLDASRTLGAGEARTFVRIAIPAAGAEPGRRPGARAGAARSASSGRR